MEDVRTMVGEFQQSFALIDADGRLVTAPRTRRFARDITEERQAETALVEAQQRLEAADSETGAVFTESRRNPDGSYAFDPISEGLQRLLHLPGDVVGQDAMVFYSRMITTPEEDAQRAVRMENAVETLEICSFEYRVRDGQDVIRWIRQSMMPRREPDGSIVFAGVMRDVTREKEAEDEIEMLRSVVVRSSDSIAIFESQPVGTSRNSRIVYVNEKFTDLFGWSMEELVGAPIETLQPNNLNVAAAQQMTAALLRNDGQPIEFETRGKDGRIFWVEMRISTIQRFDNGGFRWTVISRDISERRNTQMELLRAKEEAEAGNRAKSNFLANMSHELRTHLNAIIGFTELIEQGVERTGWTPSYGEYLVDVSESGRHLLDLINTILDLSKIESGSLRPQRSAPIESLRTRRLIAGAGVKPGARPARSNSSIRDRSPAGCPRIQGDFMKLKQVLLNILSNAIKFTPPGGKIETRGALFSRRRPTQGIADQRHRCGNRRRRPGARHPALLPGRDRAVAEIRRQRPRPVDRARAGQPAWRQARDRQHRRPGHHGADRAAAVTRSGVGKPALHQIVRVRPAGQRGDAFCPGVDVGEGGAVDAGFLIEIEIADHRDVGQGRPVGDHEATAGEMLLDRAESAQGAGAQEFGDRCLAALVQPIEESAALRGSR